MLGGWFAFLDLKRTRLPFLWAADVFAMPSLNEGFPIAAIEAVAAGVPLVCARVEGLLDVAGGNEVGGFTATTPESVADGLMYVASLEPSERRRRALNDSEIIRERFSIQNGVQSVVNGLY